MNKLRFLILFISALLLFYIYYLCEFKPLTTKNTHDPLKIACSAWPGFMPVILASELGYFKKSGIDVEYKYSENIRQQLLDFGAGVYDGAGFALGSVMALYAKASSISIIFATDYSLGADAIVANAGINSIADLKGKIIGANLGSYAEFVIDDVLLKNNLTRKDIVLQNWNDENQACKMLAAGKYDAAFLWEPYVSKAINAGAHLIYTSAEQPGIVTDVFSFQNETIASRRGDVKKFVDCWFQAVDFWEANTSEASLIISRAIGINPDFVSIKGMKLCGRLQNQKTFERAENYLSIYYGGERIAEHYIKIGIYKEKVNIDKLINPYFVKNN